MGEFERELMRRSPLAACVLESFDHVFDDQLLRGMWEQHRGRCYQDVLSFEGLTRMMRDALIRHDGSAHKLFLELEHDEANPVNESSFYRKLANTPVALSRALLREGTQRLKELMPGPAAAAATRSPPASRASRCWSATARRSKMRPSVWPPHAGSAAG